MDSNARESLDSKAEFRKPSNDAASRKYRRRSPVGGSSSSSDGVHAVSTARVQSLQERILQKLLMISEKRDDGRNQTGRSGEPYKQSDRQASRSYYRQDEHSRRDRNVDDYDRGYSKSSYRSGRDSRDNSNSDYSRSDKEHRSKDYVNDVDTYSHAKYDGSGHRSRDKDSYDRVVSGKRPAITDERDRDRDRDRHRDDWGDRYGRIDHKKSSGDHKSERSPGYEESRAQRNDSSFRNSRLKESSLRDSKEMDADDENRRHEGQGLYKEQGNRETKEHSGDASNKSQDSVAKKPKILSMDSTAPGPDGTSEKDHVTDSDIDAAKIAAMKAAELVNKNLVGTGYMSADQKKKLLWGNKKKTTSTEESAHRWDTTMFGDRERQEKFNKLMSLRLRWCLWPIVGREGEAKVENKQDNPDVEKEREKLQMDLERQYTAGLRRRDGRTVGLGL